MNAPRADWVRTYTGNAARQALAAALNHLVDAMLARDEDITDNAIWQPAKRAFLEELIRRAQVDLASTPAKLAPQPQPVTGKNPDRQCPDSGVCHHLCAAGCLRVSACSPLSGVYPGNEWPAEVRAQQPSGFSVTDRTPALGDD